MPTAGTFFRKKTACRRRWKSSGRCHGGYPEQLPALLFCIGLTVGVGQLKCLQGFAIPDDTRDGRERRQVAVEAPGIVDLRH